MTSDQRYECEVPEVGIRLCENCEKHAAIAVFDDNWSFQPCEEREYKFICGWCAPQFSIFNQGAMNIAENRRMQRDADARMLEVLS